MSEDAHETPQLNTAENPEPKPLPAHADDPRQIAIGVLYEAETRTLPSGRTFTRNRCRVCRCYWDDGHLPQFADQNEQECHDATCPLHTLPEEVKPPGTPASDVAMAEYNYWRQFAEDDQWAEGTMGAMGAAANILAGVLLHRVLHKDEHATVVLSDAKRRVQAAEAAITGGLLVAMLEELRTKLASEAEAGIDFLYREAMKDSLEYFAEWEARLRTALALAPAMKEVQP